MLFRERELKIVKVKMDLRKIVIIYEEEYSTNEIKIRYNRGQSAQEIRNIEKGIENIKFKETRED